jgi:diguanylate cyclase
MVRQGEQVRDAARRTLDTIEELGLLPTPEIFSVWYAYHSDSNPGLVRAVELIRERGEALDAARCQELFDRFLGTAAHERRLQAAGQRLGELAQRLTERIGGLSAETERYGASLGAANQAAATISDRSQIMQLVGSILAETAMMQNQAELLTQHLVESTAHIQDLRRDLQDAWREARTDVLTGLANRRHLDAALRAAAAQAIEREAPVSLILADIDNFKLLNDRYGHQVGDAALRQIAATLRSGTRPTDLVGRYGGEEFALILPETNLRGGFGLADRLRHAVASTRLKIRHSREDLGKVTISLGVATYHPGETVADWVQRADAALYEAKRAGRNRVVALDHPKAAPGPAAARLAEPRGVLSAA